MGQGQHKTQPAAKLLRCLLTAPGIAEPYSLWLNVEQPEDGIAIVKLALAQGIELGPDWEVSIEGQHYRGEVLVDGKLRCRAI